MNILAIDPGTESSAWVLYDSGTHRIRELEIEQNEDLLSTLDGMSFHGAADILAVEMVQGLGMPVGQHVFETVLWTGRFVERWGREWAKLYRKDVTLTLCGSRSAKDANVRRALLDRFERSGGGKTPEVGTKAQPGPLYGCKTHLWSALAVAVTAAELHERRELFTEDAA